MEILLQNIASVLWIALGVCFLWVKEMEQAV